MEGEPKAKLNNFGELIEDEIDQSANNDAGYINKEGEFVRGRDAAELSSGAKLNNFGELTGDEPGQLQSDAGYINKKGEFVRGRDKKETGQDRSKDNKEELPIHLL